MRNASERNFSARVAYDGTAYAGFQLQPDQPTVQGGIEEALSKVLAGEVRVHGASRTDAGVHALGQMISFRHETTLPAGEMAEPPAPWSKSDRVTARGTVAGVVTCKGRGWVALRGPSGRPASSLALGWSRT